METAADLEQSASAGDLNAQVRLARRLINDGHPEKAVDWLRRAAAAGATDAKLALAERLLAYAPYDVFEGFKWARSAADDGDGKAAHLVAVATAEGLGTPQNLQAALDYLQMSAKLGHRAAQRELLALAGDWKRAMDPAAESTPENWKRVRDSIDVLAWLKSPAAQIVSAAPRIMVVEKFASAQICNWLIEAGRPDLKRAKAFDPNTGGGRYEAARSNSAAAIGVDTIDMVLVFIRARIAALTRLPILGFEDPTILHYSPGEEFLPHYDYLENISPAFEREIQSSGQRLVTFLGYLNDDYEDGETAFPVLGWRYKGKKGDAMFFYNATPDGAPDRRTLHTGTPTSRGEKWVLSQWIRFRPAAMR